MDVVFLSTFPYRNVFPSVLIKWGVSWVLKTGHNSELEVKQGFQHHFLCWCLSGSPEVKRTTSISKNEWHMDKSSKQTYGLWESQKPVNDLCILGFAFLFSSEEANCGGPAVVHGHPSELVSSSSPKGKRLLQISIAGKEGGWVIRIRNRSHYWKCWQKLNAQ